jgi:predicted transcriptional regulator
MTAITVRPDAKMAKELEKYAKMHDRSKAYMLKEAWELYVERDNWLNRKYEQAQADIKAGRFATEEDMSKLYNKYAPTKSTRKAS